MIASVTETGRMSIRRSRSLASHLSIFGVVLLTPLALLMVYFAEVERRTAYDAAGSYAATLVEQTRGREAALIRQIETLLNFLADAPEVIEGGAVCDGLLHRLRPLHEWVSGVRLTAPSGDAICGDRPGIMAYNIADRPYFIDALRTPGLSISDVFRTIASGIPRVAASRPVHGPDGQRGILHLFIQPYVFGTLMPVTVRGDTLVGLLDRKGTPLARLSWERGQADEDVATEFLLRQAVEGEIRVVETRDTAGIPRIMAFRRSIETGSLIYVALARQPIDAAVNRQLIFRLTLLGGMIALVGLIGLLGTRSLVIRPIRALARAAGEVENGKAGALVQVRGIGELNDLASSLDFMVAALQRREKQLLLAEEVADSGHWYLDLASGNLTWSVGMRKIHRHAAPAGPPTIEGWLATCHPQDRERLAHTLETAQASPQPFTLAFRVCLPEGGAVRHIICRAIVESSASLQPTALFGVVVDVTELQQLTSLLQEKSELLDAALEGMDQGLVIMTADGALPICNRRAVEFLGLPIGFIGAGRSNASRPARPGDLGRCVDTDAPGVTLLPLPQDPVLSTVEHETTGGIALEIRTQPIRGGGVVRTYADITSRRRAEQGLQENRAELESIIAAAGASIVVIDRAGIIQKVNASATTMFGHPAEALVGCNIASLMPDPLSQLDDAHQGDDKGASRSFIIGRNRKVLARRVDGQTFPIELAVGEMRVGDRQLFTGVIHDVTERHEQEDRLLRAKERAEAATAAKAEFLSNMSHELRTPLTGIIGFAELLLAGVEQERQAQFLVMQRDAAKALLRVVNDILDFEKLEAGRFVIEEMAFDPRRLAEECLAMVQESAAVKSLKLELKCDPLPALVDGDPNRLRQILLNLLTNAVKFTRRGQIILTVTATEPPGEYLFSVADTGVGVPAELLPKLFHRFSQLDCSATREHSGTGLGLAISRRLVKLMGGKIGVTSHVGKGSTFWFRIPLATSTTPALASHAGDLGDTPPGLRVLVAEDSSLNQKLLEAVLRRYGHEVVLVNNGEEAITAARTKNFDLILMDMQMPLVDGLTAIRMIRRFDGPAATVPIIALTANALREDVLRCLSGGADAHVAKPVDWRRLAATIRNLCSEAVADRRSHELAPTPPDEPVPAVLDAAVFDGFRAMLGERRFPGLLAQFRIKIAEARAAIARPDAAPAELAASAHRIAGTAGMFGCRDLSTTAGRLEHAATLDRPDTKTVAEALVAACDRALAALAADPDPPAADAAALAMPPPIKAAEPMALSREATQDAPVLPPAVRG